MHFSDLKYKDKLSFCLKRLEAEQKGWLRAVNECDGDLEACDEYAYRVFLSDCLTTLRAIKADLDSFDEAHHVHFINNEDSDPVRVTRLEIEEIDDPGCNNGHYPAYKLTYVYKGNEHEISGSTCRCRKGCSNTDCVADLEGRTFPSVKALYDYLMWGAQNDK